MSQLSNRYSTKSHNFGTKKIKARPKTTMRLNFDDYDTIGSRATRKNPYQIPHDNEVFQIQDEESAEKYQRHKFLSNQTLMYRNCPAALPKLPSIQLNDNLHEQTTDFFPQSKKTYTIFQAPKVSDYGEVFPVGPEHQDKEQLSEFVDQKRKIFLAQLLINRKQKEIERIEQQEKAEDSVFQDQQNKIKETKNQFKMTMNQIEAEYSRQKKAADLASKNKTEFSNNLKRKKAKLLAIDLEIASNDEELIKYRSYRDFLNKIKIDYTNPKTPRDSTLIQEEFEYLENENLFLFSKCAELLGIKNSIYDSVKLDIENAEQESAEIEQKSDQLKNVTVPLIPAHSKLLEKPEVVQMDQELHKLAIYVKKAYEQCFGKATEISPLMMLHRLETELEQLYRKSKQIPEKEILEKQNAKEKERREKQRIEKQMAQIREQQAKNDAAIERSKMPVKQRTGRPLIERTIPVKISRHIKQNNDEDEELNNLLYGPIND